MFFVLAKCDRCNIAAKEVLDFKPFDVNAVPCPGGCGGFLVPLGSLQSRPGDEIDEEIFGRRVPYRPADRD